MTTSKHDMEALLWVLNQIIVSLPKQRDWLDPAVEREARELLRVWRK